MARELIFIVPPEYDGKKLFRFLRGGANLSATLVATLRHTPGSVKIGDTPVRTIDCVWAQDAVRVTLPESESEIESTYFPLDIIFEDQDLLVLNKPPTIAVHPSHGHQNDTLANAVAFYLRQKGQCGAFRAIGRLDKGTSGVLLCALNSYAASRLSGNTDKTYVALCVGELEGSGTVDEPIYRPDEDKTLRACGSGGERAVTHYETLAADNGVSLVRLRLETGRTHQIRVHMAHIGAPLFGDSLYGQPSDTATHHMLHCERVGLTHPVTNEKMIFTATPPDDFAALVSQLLPEAYDNK